MTINCSYKLATIYGPFSINIYGLFIALGIVICMQLVPFNARYFQLHLQKKFADIIVVSIIAGIFGGRLLEIISSPSLYPHWKDCLSIWEGGFSVLGSILGVIMITPLYLTISGIPILPTCDLVAIYAPLFQSIARLGCFFVGCCHGTSTKLFFHVLYTHQETIAPHNIMLHPTQLYSSFILFCIFLYMFFIAQHRIQQAGFLFLTYLSLSSAERFIVDFWRADRIIMYDSFLSFHQTVALAIMCLSVMMMIITAARNRQLKNVR